MLALACDEHDALAGHVSGQDWPLLRLPEMQLFMATIAKYRVFFFKHLSNLVQALYYSLDI